MLQLARLTFLVTWQQRSQFILAAAVFVLIYLLFVIAVNDPRLIDQMHWTIIWVIVILAVIQVIPNLFVSDVQSGVIEQLRLSSIPLWHYLFYKVFWSWLLTILPIVFIVLALNNSGLNAYFFYNLLKLLLGSIALFLLGSNVAAIMATVANSQLLIALILLPLNIPILIFGSSHLATLQIEISSLLWLTALCLFFLLVTPILTIACLTADPS